MNFEHDLSVCPPGPRQCRASSSRSSNESTIILHAIPIESKSTSSIHGHTISRHYPRDSSPGDAIIRNTAIGQFYVTINETTTTTNNKVIPRTHTRRNTHGNTHPLRKTPGRTNVLDPSPHHQIPCDFAALPDDPKAALHLRAPPRAALPPDRRRPPPPALPDARRAIR